MNSMGGRHSKAAAAAAAAAVAAGSRILVRGAGGPAAGAGDWGFRGTGSGRPAAAQVGGPRPWKDRPQCT